MGLNKQRGNMFPWVTHTINPIKGCLHDCSYCYLRSLLFFEMTPRFEEREVKRGLGKGRVIFVGSASDMWGVWVPDVQIHAVLEQCMKYPDNTYLFQSKNPERFKNFIFPPKTILGTTIETNRQGLIQSKAPKVESRVQAMVAFKDARKMVSLEPIMDFDLEAMVRMISLVGPEFVSIGADSKNHALMEPSWKKVRELIERLGGITEVREKENLERLKSTVNKGQHLWGN